MKPRLARNAGRGLFASAAGLLAAYAETAKAHTIFTVPTHYSSATGSRSMAMRSSALPPPPTLYFSKK
jgi:hypothetical protein